MKTVIFFAKITAILFSLSGLLFLFWIDYVFLTSGNYTLESSQIILANAGLLFMVILGGWGFYQLINYDKNKKALYKKSTHGDTSVDSVDGLFDSSAGDTRISH